MQQQEGQLQQAEAWATLLHHPAVCQDLALVARLMCSSRTVKAMLQHAAAGQLTCPADRLPRRLRQRWAGRYGGLLQRLEAPEGSGGQLAAGLAAAAASTPHGLLLQSCRADLQDLLPAAGPDSATAAGSQQWLLQLLPPQHLTSLEVSDIGGPAAGLAALAAGLTRLTALRQLSLQASGFGAALQPLGGLLATALPALRQLTSLQVAAGSGCESAALLNPATAAELLLSCSRDRQRDPHSPEEELLPIPLQLGHLTCVTRLARFSSTDPTLAGSFSPLALAAVDLLPPQLVQLDIDLAACGEDWAGALLPLAALRGLTAAVAADSAAAAGAATAQLGVLAAQLTGLQRLELTVRCSAEVPAQGVVAAAARLPLVHLSLTDMRWTAAMVSQLSSLTRLTHLSSFGSPLAVPGLPQLEHALRGLAGAVRALPVLQELHLFGLVSRGDVGGGLFLGPEAAFAAGVAAGTAEWLAAPGAMPTLRSFAADYSLPGASVLQLATATQLQDLTLISAGLTDPLLIPVLTRLTGLTSLCCSFNARLTDASVAAMAALRQLQSLELQAVPATNAGLAHLSLLTRLRRLRCSDTEFRGTLAGVAWLLQLRELQELALSSPRVLWRRAARRLRRRLPRLVILFDDEHNERFRSDDEPDDDGDADESVSDDDESDGGGADGGGEGGPGAASTDEDDDVEEEADGDSGGEQQ